MYEEPLQKVESMIEDHAEHFKSTVVQKIPPQKYFKIILNLDLSTPCAWKNKVEYVMKKF